MAILDATLNTGVMKGLQRWQKLDWKQKLLEMSRECHNHKPQPTPDIRGREKGKKKNQRVQNKPTNVREALSSPSEMITMLNMAEKKKKTQKNNNNNNNTRPKSKARLNVKRSVVKPTKPHKTRITPGPPP